ncbi:hypothetical protein MD484_g2026, partial [Candolleomyces efflorescens]
MWEITSFSDDLFITTRTDECSLRASPLPSNLGQMPPNPLPAWLASVSDSNYLRQALNVLAGREVKREIARDASRLQLGPSQSKAGRQLSKAGIVSDEHVDHYSVKIGASQDHVSRNRYYQLEAYDRTRVTISTSGRSGVGSGFDTQNCQTSHYLNASWVLEKFGQKWWIATQAPLPHTANTFLNIILKPVTLPSPIHSSNSRATQIRTVVQLTKDIEGGRRKAHPYFPNTVGKFIVVPAEPEISLPALKVTLLLQEPVEEAHCLKSVISVVPVTNPPPRSSRNYDYMDTEEDAGEKDRYGEQNEARAIFTHLLYTSWPDHGVPEDEDRKSLLSFLRLADRINRDGTMTSIPSSSSSPSPDPDPPIIVGCSAGVGRTGSFIALSSLLRHLGELPPPACPTSSSVIPPSPLGPLPELFRDDLVAQEIDSLREQRQRMVERPEQVLLIYEMLEDLLGAS